MIPGINSFLKATASDAWVKFGPKRRFCWVDRERIDFLLTLLRISFRFNCFSFRSSQFIHFFFNFVIPLFFVVLDKGNVLGQIVDVFLVKVVPFLGLEALAFPPSLFVAVVVKHEV